MAGEFWWWMTGATCLGLVVGWLIYVFVKRAPSLPLKALTTLVSIAGGGVSLAIVAKLETSFPAVAISGYFIGVFVAVVILGLLDHEPTASN